MSPAKEKIASHSFPKDFSRTVGKGTERICELTKDIFECLQTSKDQTKVLFEKVNHLLLWITDIRVINLLFCSKFYHRLIFLLLLFLALRGALLVFLVLFASSRSTYLDPCPSSRLQAKECLKKAFFLVAEDCNMTAILPRQVLWNLNKWWPFVHRVLMIHIFTRLPAFAGCVL